MRWLGHGACSFASPGVPTSSPTCNQGWEGCTEQGEAVRVFACAPALDDETARVLPGKSLQWPWRADTVRVTVLQSAPVQRKRCKGGTLGA